jgi:hypothetical protein
MAQASDAAPDFGALEFLMRVQKRPRIFDGLRQIGPDGLEIKRIAAIAQQTNFEQRHAAIAPWFQIARNENLRPHEIATAGVITKSFAHDGSGLLPESAPCRHCPI